MHNTLICLDWGTSSLRAYLLDRQGTVMETQQRPWGVMQLPSVKDLPTVANETPGDQRKHAFQHVLNDACGAWLTANPSLPILACGMVGSAQGWQEAGYLETPTSLHSLAHNLTRVERSNGNSMYIVPGLIQRSALPNVMSG